jgi:hypothetical protein
MGEVRQPLLVRAVGLEVVIEHVVGDDRPFAAVLRLPASPRPRSHGVPAHQQLYPVQAARKPVLEHVAPDTAGAIGAVAGPEAFDDGADELRVEGRADADRALEPGVKARPRDAQNRTSS